MAGVHKGLILDTAIQEHVPDSESIRRTRMSLGPLGDEFVEAVAGAALVELARKQSTESHHKICGQAISVPGEQPQDFRPRRALRGAAEQP